MEKEAGLEYEAIGAGEVVLLLHGAFVAASFQPLTREAALHDYRLIRLHRRGYAGSDRYSGYASIVDQARDLANFMSALRIERAHVVGHSYGGPLALQLAIDAPEKVASIAMLEPAIYTQMDPELGAATATRIAGHLERYRSGDAHGAVDGFMSGAEGPDWQHTIPGGAEQAYAAAATFFEVENDALSAWTFAANSAAHVRQPVFYVIGGGGPEARTKRMVGTQNMFTSRVPQTQTLTIPDALHTLHIRQSGHVATALAAFFARHPIRNE